MSAGQLRAMMITGSCSAEVSFAVGSIFSRPSYWLVAIAAFAIGFYWKFGRVWKGVPSGVTDWAGIHFLLLRPGNLIHATIGAEGWSRRPRACGGTVGTTGKALEIRQPANNLINSRVAALQGLEQGLTSARRFSVRNRSCPGGQMGHQATDRH